MNTLKSAMIWLNSTILTIILFFAMLSCAFLFYPSDRKRKATHAQCYWWADAVIYLNPFWKVSAEGLQNIDRHKTYVIVSNHQSLADIVVIYKTRMQFKWVAKDSLFRVPFIGWNLSLAKHIKITRGKMESIKKVYREAAGWLRDDMSVLFFPEGTRSETNKMRYFQNGAFKLAIKEKRPILPILLRGTGNAIPKGSWRFKTNSKCNLKVLPPVDTSRFQPKDFEVLRDLVRAELESASGTL